MSCSPYFPGAENWCGEEQGFLSRSQQPVNHLQPRKTHQQHGDRDCCTPTDFSPADSKFLTEFAFSPSLTVASLPTIDSNLSPTGGLVAPLPIYAEPSPTKPPTIPPLTATLAYSLPTPSPTTTNTPLPVAIAENSSPATTNTPWPAAGANSHPPSPTLPSTITTTLPLPTVAIADSPPNAPMRGSSIPVSVPVDGSNAAGRSSAVGGSSIPVDGSNAAGRSSAVGGSSIPVDSSPLPAAVGGSSIPVSVSVDGSNAAGRSSAVGGSSIPVDSSPLPAAAVGGSSIPVDSSPLPAAVGGSSPPHDAAINGQKRGYVDAFESLPLERKYKRIQLRAPRMFPKAAVEQVLHCQSYADQLYDMATESNRESIAFMGALIVSHYSGMLRCQTPLCDKPCQILPSGSHHSICRCCNTGTTVVTFPEEPSVDDQHCTKVFTKAQMDDAKLLKKLLKDPSIERFKRLRDKLNKHCFRSDGLVNPLGLKNVLQEEVGRKNDQVCSRNLIGFNFAPLLLKIYADALELKEGVHYTHDDMESLVNKIVLHENSKTTFSYGKEQELFGKHYWKLYWAVRLFLDLVEGSLAYGLVDCLVNLLACEGLKGTSNSILLEVWASTGFLLSTISRCAAYEGKEVALPTFIKDNGNTSSGGSDRSAPGPLIIATKIRLLKELIRCACSVGFDPAPLFTREAKQYAEDFEKIISGGLQWDCNNYFQSLFNGIVTNDTRPMGVIAQSVCDCVWSQTRNCLLIFPACLAACVGMLLKVVVYQNSNGGGGPYEKPLLKDGRRLGGIKGKDSRSGDIEGKSIKFCNGFTRTQNSTIAEMANPVFAASFDDFRLVKQGVITDLFEIFRRILDFNTLVEQVTAIGKGDITDVEDNAVFSLNYHQLNDVFYGGTTLAEKEKLMKTWTLALQLHKQRSNMEAGTNEVASNEYVRKNPDHIRDSVAIVGVREFNPELEHFVERLVGNEKDTVGNNVGNNDDITTVANVTNRGAGNDC